MASELGIVSLPELQNFVQFQQQQSQPIIWNLKQVSDKEAGDISWEVKAFEQDSNNVTWPPRSYTCTFCTREFRSAQALGGHMNVHRRDRARLHHQTLPPLPSPPPPTTATTNNNINPFFSNSSKFLIQAQEVVTNDGVCIVYSLPKAAATTMNSCTNSNSLSKSTSPAYNKFYYQSSYKYKNNTTSHELLSASKITTLDGNDKKVDMVFEEIDLELRLGQRI